MAGPPIAGRTPEKRFILREAPAGALRTVRTINRPVPEARTHMLLGAGLALVAFRSRFSRSSRKRVRELPESTRSV